MVTPVLNQYLIYTTYYISWYVEHSMHLKH